MKYLQIFVKEDKDAFQALLKNKRLPITVQTQNTLEIITFCFCFSSLRAKQALFNSTSILPIPFSWQTYNIESLFLFFIYVQLLLDAPLSYYVRALRCYLLLCYRYSPPIHCEICLFVEYKKAKAKDILWLSIFLDKIWESLRQRWMGIC